MPGVRGPTSSGTNSPVETILIVEDDTVVAAFLSAAIEQETPYQALLATSSSQVKWSMGVNLVFFFSIIGFLA